MKRKTKKQMVQRVLQLLETKPMTVNEIAVNINSNWDTVNKTLEILESLSLVEWEGEGNKKLFKARVDGTLTLRKDTLFGIPIIRERDENLCKMLFMKLKQKWFEKNHTYPNKTLMQKMVVKVADNFNLTIPRGWYIFGKMTILQYDQEIDYPYEDVEIQDINPYLNEIVDHFSKFVKTFDVQLDQYEDNKKMLYLAKLKIQEILSKYVFDKETSKNLSNLFFIFAKEFPAKGDNLEIIESINAFVSTVNQLLIQKSKEELDQIRQLMMDSFASVWESMAIYNLFDSLVEENFGYERRSLKKYFDKRIETLLAISWDYIAELDLLIERPELNKNSPLLKFKGIIYKLRKLSEEERKVLFEEFSKDKSDIFREFNL